MESERIDQYFANHGIKAVSLWRRETIAIQRTWRNVFAAGLKSERGRWMAQQKGMDWHVFWDGHSTCKKGFKAEEAYAALPGGDFWVILSFDQVVAYKCSGESLPDGRELSDFCASIMDIYVSALDFEWTMVFTHEQDIGPFFSRKEWQQFEDDIIIER